MYNPHGIDTRNLKQHILFKTHADNLYIVSKKRTLYHETQRFLKPDKTGFRRPITLNNKLIATNVPVHHTDRATLIATSDDIDDIRSSAMLEFL